MTDDFFNEDYQSAVEREARQAQYELMRAGNCEWECHKEHELQVDAFCTQLCKPCPTDYRECPIYKNRKDSDAEKN